MGEDEIPEPSRQISFGCCSQPFEAGRMEREPCFGDRHDDDASRCDRPRAIDDERDERAREQPQTGEAEEKAEHDAMCQPLT